jgi:hypothetical protein
MKLLRTLGIVTVMALAGSAYAKAPAKGKKPPAAAKDPGNGDAKGDAKNEVSAADAQKFTAFFDKLVEVALADKGNCDKLATDVSALVSSNTELFKAAQEAKKNHRKLPKATQAHMIEGFKKMSPVLLECKDNPKVKAAFEQLDMKKQ